MKFSRLSLLRAEFSWVCPGGTCKNEPRHVFEALMASGSMQLLFYCMFSPLRNALAGTESNCTTWGMFGDFLLLKFGLVLSWDFRCFVYCLFLTVCGMTGSDTIVVMAPPLFWDSWCWWWAYCWWLDFLEYCWDFAELKCIRDRFCYPLFEVVWTYIGKFAAILKWSILTDCCYDGIKGGYLCVFMDFF